MKIRRDRLLDSRGSQLTKTYVVFTLMFAPQSVFLQIYLSKNTFIQFVNVNIHNLIGDSLEKRIVY